SERALWCAIRQFARFLKLDIFEYVINSALTTLVKWQCDARQQRFELINARINRQLRAGLVERGLRVVSCWLKRRRKHILLSNANTTKSWDALQISFNSCCNSICALHCSDANSVWPSQIFAGH